jgi:uncharacterized caspase-like protein
MIRYYPGRAIVALLAITLAALMPAPAQAEKRVALVIGNSAYQHVGRLDNPINDARLMADTLRSLGFTLIGDGPQVDLDRPRFERAVQAFGRALVGADVGLFYFAGHGVQVGGGNYLVPIEANPTREADVGFQMLNANLVLSQMDGAGTKLNLVILDACRNNPFGGQGLRSGGRGLAQIQAPEGTLVSYATQPNSVAQDGSDGNSPYTRALAQAMKRPGLDIFRTFNEVGLAVSNATGGAQRPWVSLSPIKGDFYFVPPAAQAPAPPPMAADEVLWTTIRDSRMAALFEEFLRRFPASPRAAEARARLDELRKPSVAASPPAQPAPAAAPRPVPAAPPAPSQPAAPAAPSRPALTALPSPSAVPSVPWTAGATDVAAWRLRATTRLGGALSSTGVSFDRTSVAVAGHREGSLHIVDASTLKPRAKIMLAGYEAYSLSGIAILDDNRRVAAVRGGALEVYDIASKALVQRLPADNGYPNGHLVLSKDGQQLYSIRTSASPVPPRTTIRVYRPASDGLKLEAEYVIESRLESFDVTADGSRFLLATLFPARELVLYDARRKQPIWARTCQCSARFGAKDRLVVFAGRPGETAGNFGANSVIGVLDVADPDRRAIFDTRGKESLKVDDVSPDQLFAAVGSTNNGQVTIVPVSLDAPSLTPAIILKDNSGQNVAGAKFVGREALVSMSGDNNARLWKK